MFKKLFDSSGERKSILYNNSMSLLDCLSSAFNYDNKSSAFIKSYLESSPVFTATNLISQACSNINTVIYDKKKDVIINDHPALTLIRNPNPFTDEVLFKNEIYSYFILTGNAYLNITGNGKPVELSALNPKSINIEADASDGYAQKYTYTQNNGSVSYIRDAKKKFISRNNNELTHLRKFNPEYSSNNLYGMSTFAGVQLEISQYTLANVHNNSLLKNQGRPSGLISFKGDQDMLSKEQAIKIREEIQDKLQGAANAGRPLFLSGNFTWQQLSQSIRDMDFDNLKKSTTQAIYNAAGVPLPMVSPDNMTLANMDSSKYNFYDGTVIPIVNRVNSFLTKSILSRYPNSENLEFTYDESEIGALQTRKIENTISRYKDGIITLDEARTEIGYEQTAGAGGDLFYRPSNLIPIASDSYTANERDRPTKSVEKAEYIRLMTSLTGLDGKRLYNDDFINKNVAIYYK